MCAASCPEPTPAERARSVLAAAGSLTVTTQGHRVELIGLHTVDAAARLLLHNPPDGHLAAELAVAPHGDLAALAEFTDIAPVAVRERVRARLTLGGWLSALGPKTLVFNPARAVLAEGDGTAVVGLDELALASPDPQATHEAEMLARLDATHADTVAPLARLLPAREQLGATVVRPLRLDRHGLVLRSETPDSHHDTRLPFDTSATHPGEAVRQIHVLLARATARPRHRRLPTSS
ncbi:DUF2470 domain-containing protein [Streptomyces ferrugineus]|uniref:DUF2470 domain-containing protein n=1 Tax=Streptomyces ferrugineus TaxID=1413221 RepID=A0A7M2SHA9_9ACTN|nr:DUF2470 domain-containing protein [Streptomyces ferrugineus]QOV34848.1 DUF2470 domain-containing protein [Streptomyces ferrugineus]